MCRSRWVSSGGQWFGWGVLQEQTGRRGVGTSLSHPVSGGAAHGGGEGRSNCKVAAKGANATGRCSWSRYCLLSRRAMRLGGGGAVPLIYVSMVSCGCHVKRYVAPRTSRVHRSKVARGTGCCLARRSCAVCCRKLEERVVRGAETRVSGSIVAVLARLIMGNCCIVSNSRAALW